MPSISLYFKAHHPYRIKSYTAVDVGVEWRYFNDKLNEECISQLSDECYLPGNAVLLSEIEKQQGEFKVTFSLSGSILELLQKYRPDVIDSFRSLVDTGCVEILGETYYNSLSYLYSTKEFIRQIEKHSQLVHKLFGIEPTVFRNTELIHNNDLARIVADAGFKGMLCEGLDKILNGRNPNITYAAPDNGDFALLLRNINLSDDLAFRFGESTWNEHPLTAEKFAGWIKNHPADTSNINLFLDYETLGIHKKVETGIFDFLQQFPGAVLSTTDYKFSLPSEAIEQCYPRDIYNVPETISWRDKSEECCVWCSNSQQNNTLKKIYDLEKLVMQGGDKMMIETWGRLQSADNFYYMATEERFRGDAYDKLNPFFTAQEAYHAFVNIMTDFEIRLIKLGLEKYKNRHPAYTDTIY